MKRVLIELDTIIDTGSCGQFEHFKNENNLKEDMSDFFDTIISDAFYKKMDVWDAILNHDEIWVNSAFIGDSGRLLIQMLDNADKYRIKNKTVINMRTSDSVYSYLSPDAMVLIDRVKSNKVNFIYSDDEAYQKYLP